MQSFEFVATWRLAADPSGLLLAAPPGHRFAGQSNSAAGNSRMPGLGVGTPRTYRLHNRLGFLAAHLVGTSDEGCIWRSHLTSDSPRFDHTLDLPMAYAHATGQPYRQLASPFEQS